MIFDIDYERCAQVEWECVTRQESKACIGVCGRVGYYSTSLGTKNMLKLLAWTQMLGMIYNDSPSQKMHLHD